MEHHFFSSTISNQIIPIVLWCSRISSLVCTVDALISRTSIRKQRDSPSSLVTPRQPISSCRDRALSLLMSQYSTNFFTHFLGLDFLRSKRLNGLISFFPMSPLEFLSSWLKYQWTTRSSRVWLGSGSSILNGGKIKHWTCLYALYFLVQCLWNMYCI